MFEFKSGFNFNKWSSDDICQSKEFLQMILEAEWTLCYLLQHSINMKWTLFSFIRACCRKHFSVSYNTRENLPTVTATAEYPWTVHDIFRQTRCSLPTSKIDTHSNYSAEKELSLEHTDFKIWPLSTYFCNFSLVYGNWLKYSGFFI